MNLHDGYAYEGAFIKQTTKGRIAYDNNYVNKSRTTPAMAYLRLGWLSAHMPHDELRAAKVVDIGSGAGVMVDALKQACAIVKNYDLCGGTIDVEELRSTDWDIVVLNDVLEHYDNIDALFDLKWRYAFISFPETPDVADFNTLRTWRHFRPDEHIYHLHESGVRAWAASLGAETIAAGCFEDILRARWDPALRNITTILLRRAQ